MDTLPQILVSESASGDPGVTRRDSQGCTVVTTSVRTWGAFSALILSLRLPMGEPYSFSLQRVSFLPVYSLSVQTKEIELLEQA